MMTCNKVFKCAWYKKCLAHLEAVNAVQPDLRRTKKEK